MHHHFIPDEKRIDANKTNEYAIQQTKDGDEDVQVHYHGNGQSCNSLCRWYYKDAEGEVKWNTQGSLQQ